MPLTRRARPAAAATLAAAVVLSLSPALTAHAATPSTTWTAAGHGDLLPVSGRPTAGDPALTAHRTRPQTKASASRPHFTTASSVTYQGSLSTFVVHYDSGFNGAAGSTQAKAKASFGAAATTWANAVTSSIPILVNASLTQFADPAQLGQAGPANFFHQSPQAPYYPAALANALAGSDLDTSADGNDISAEFANNPDLFYYGTDGGVASATCGGQVGGCYDFESVVLHELGHGLGFIGSVHEEYSNPELGTGDLGTSAWGTPTYPATSQHAAMPGDDIPYVFDLLTGTGDGTATLGYANHSVALHAAVTGNSMYWFGGYGASADRGREPRLYADDPFLPGSSYSHLSDASYPDGDADSLMTPYAMNGVTTRSPGTIALGMFRDMGWVTRSLPGARYTPVTPVRVLDTGSSKVPGGQYVTRQIGGDYGVPKNATAVVLNVTGAVPTSTASVIKVYPLPRADGAPVPEATVLNTAVGDNRANLVTVPLSLIGPATGTTGSVRFLNTGGATRIVADLAGYYAPASTTYFHTVSPTRVMDTRYGTGVRRGGVGTGGVVTLKLAGTNGIPTTATSVVLTVTAIAPTTSSYVTVYPAGTSQATSNINLKAGTVAANQIIVKIGSGGSVSFRNYSGLINLAADLAGWYDTNASGGLLFRPVLAQPVSRVANNVTEVPLTTHDQVDFPVVDDLYGVPPKATAAVLNITGRVPSASTYLTLYPSGASRPTASNVNLAAGQTAASLGTVRLGTNGLLTLYNYNGNVTTHLDLQGWFGPA